MHENEKWKGSRSVVSDSSDPMDYSPAGSSVHGIFQAKVLERGAIAFSDIHTYWEAIGYWGMVLVNILKNLEQSLSFIFWTWDSIPYLTANLYLCISLKMMVMIW